MSTGANDAEEEFLSLNDMHQWAQQELKDIAKAAELRVKSVNAIITRYSAGELTPEQATEEHFRYQHRWGEALPGAAMADGVSDEQILDMIDKARGRFAGVHETKERYSRLFGTRPGGGRSS